MITRYIILDVLFLTVCLCFSAVASPIDECYKESDNRIEVSKCLDNKLSKSESSLDKKVAEVRNNMQKLSKQINTIYPIRSFNLSQQAFLMYRKSNCDWLFDKSYVYGGSGDVLKDCLIRMNLDRIIELDRDYKFESVENNKTPNPDKKKNKESVKKSPSSSNKESDRDNNIDHGTRYDNSEYQEYEEPLNVDLPDDCYLIPDQGECKGSFLRYYYYEDIGKCRAFLWGGCNGVVPFESMTECREVCVQNN
jgi:uncharacterized protein YecT (DUF1311 family)